MDKQIQIPKRKKGKIPKYKNNDPTPKQNVHIPRQIIPVPRQTIPKPRQNIPVPRQNIPVPRTFFSMPRQQIPQLTSNFMQQPNIPNFIPQNPGGIVEGIKAIARIVQLRQQVNSMFTVRPQSQVPPHVRNLTPVLPTPKSLGAQSSSSRTPTLQSSDLKLNTLHDVTSQDVKSNTDCENAASTSSSKQDSGVEKSGLKSFGNLDLDSQSKVFPSTFKKKRIRRKRRDKKLNYINSETHTSSITLPEELPELDDGCFNSQTIDISKQNITQDNKINIFKQSQQSFQTKFQNQHAKNLVTRNNYEPKQIPGNSCFIFTDDKELTHTESDELIKQPNRELLDGSSSDVNTSIRENTQFKMNEQRNYAFNEQVPKMAGIPRSFLRNQDTYGAIMPQDSTNNPVSRLSLQNKTFASTEPQMFVQTDYPNTNQPQTYSPTDLYEEIKPNEEEREGSESPDMLEPGQKRLSAFQRLGPLAQPKKPKLTINLSLGKDQAIREVVETHKEIPVYDNEEIINSTDETVIEYLPFWPWKKTVPVKKSVTARFSKTVMIMEQEQMEEVYEKNCNTFIMLSVKGYPPNWKKEELLDMMLDNLKGKYFVPCFIEFNSKECKFFVIRSRAALITIHWSNFVMRKDDVEITITISQTLLKLKKIDFLPRAVLKKRLRMHYDGHRALDLREFTLKYDISHFIYFPLNRAYNQFELVQIQSDVVWEYLTELNLSHNRITSVEGFSLETTTPKLRILDLSHNYIESIKVLLKCRQLPLKSLMLEGNPLCTDYTDPARYVQVIRMMFPCIRELDGIPITLKGEIPMIRKNYCPEDAKVVVDRFLEIYFPLLELPQEDRKIIQAIYSDQAVMTITYRNKISHDPKFRNARHLLTNSRDLLKNDAELLHGASNIEKMLRKWPNMQHDPLTFTVDVIYHNDSSTIFRISGILKLTSESLVEDETLLSFTRTVHLHSRYGDEYKIYNEMLYWDEPTQDCTKRAFQMLSIPKKRTFDLTLESTPDDQTKEQLLKVFMKITELEKLPSERCLEAKDWHIKHAIEYYMQLLKLDIVHCLMN